MCSLGRALQSRCGALCRESQLQTTGYFFLLGFWIPLLVLGIFGWYVPPRYTEFALLPMLICALASWQQLANNRIALAPIGRIGFATLGLALIAGTAVVNPRALAHVVDSGSSFPDHKGAAAFMRSIRLGPRDIVIAEEVLMQKYYLGRVDYWLVDSHVAAMYMQRFDGKIVDEYTHTPLLGTADALTALVRRPDRGAIYVIGSGENQQDGRLFMRGPGISALLKTDQFRVIYVAHDGLTKIWKVDAPGASVTAVAR